MDQSKVDLENHIMERTLWMKKSPEYRADAIRRILYKMKTDGKDRSDPFRFIRTRAHLQNNIATPEDFPR